MSDSTLRTAGAVGDETSACTVFGDDVVEVLRVIRATLANIHELGKLGCEPDRNATNSVLFEACLIRVVDRALTYLSGSLHAVFRKHPNSARVKEELALNFISGFSSIDELIEALIERKVYQLSYRSLDDLDGYLQESFKFSLFSSDDQRRRAVRLVAERNLIVHNHGIVNRVFQERARDSGLDVGDRVGYDAPSAMDAIGFLFDWVADLDVRMIEKFGLDAKPRMPRPKIDNI